MVKKNQNKELMSVSLASLISCMCLVVGLALGMIFGKEMERHVYLDYVSEAAACDDNFRKYLERH